MYEPSARIVAFTIHRKKLEAWIRAMGILYYEHFGKIGPPHHIHWYDEPDHWEKEGNKAICIDVTKSSQLLYKITIL